MCAVSPEPSLFARIKYGSRRRVRSTIRHLAAHVRLKDEFTEDEKCHNLMRWLILPFVVQVMVFIFPVCFLGFKEE